MKFSESGLPNHPLLEKAFTRSFESLMAAAPQAEKEFVRETEQRHRQMMLVLDQQKNLGRLKEDDYAREKAELEKSRKESLEIGPQMIRQELQNMFRHQRLQTVLNGANWAENPSPEMLASLLLMETVRSPVDFRDVQNAFGDRVADTLGTLLHVTAYPQKRAQILTEADGDVKTAYLAMTVSNIERTGKRIEAGRAQGKLAPVMLTHGQEEQIYEDVLAVWGHDKKMDKQLVESFNKLCGLTVSPFRLEVTADGALELVKGAPPQPPRQLPPPKDNGPNNNGGFGDNVF